VGSEGVVADDFHFRGTRRRRAIEAGIVPTSTGSTSPRSTAGATRTQPAAHRPAGSCNQQRGAGGRERRFATPRAGCGAAASSSPESYGRGSPPDRVDQVDFFLRSAPTARRRPCNRLFLRPEHGADQRPASAFGRRSSFLPPPNLEPRPLEVRDRQPGYRRRAVGGGTGSSTSSRSRRPVGAPDPEGRAGGARASAGSRALEARLPRSERQANAVPLRVCTPRRPPRWADHEQPAARPLTLEVLRDRVGSGRVGCGRRPAPVVGDVNPHGIPAQLDGGTAQRSCPGVFPGGRGGSRCPGLRAERGAEV